MASKKSPKTGKYYEVDSLSPKELIDLGFDEEIKAEFKAIPDKVKDKPCAKQKKKVIKED